MGSHWSLLPAKSGRSMGAPAKSGNAPPALHRTVFSMPASAHLRSQRAGAAAVAGPQHDAFSAGAQKVACSLGAQHAEALAAFAALPLKKPVRFSGVSLSSGGALSFDAPLYTSRSNASTIIPTGASVYSCP